ncbi:TRAP transporter small permease [Sedimentitalea sp. XS_ASV28]|uniref:TRAP transporter small permease n=1 Tax=Sedimentitalea sp. XS_ASV28 TaxID=3241296 RepID=UPI003514CA22
MRWFILSLSDALNKLARYAVIAALCIMFLTVMIQVLARYVFSSPPIWTEDIARYMMVWTGLLGATISFKTRTDAVLLDSVFPERPSLLGWFAETVQSVAVLTFTLPVLYFCFVGLRGGFAKGYLARQAGLTADTLGVQMVWIVSVVPLAMIVILVHLAARWADPTGASTSAETEIQ